MRVTWKIRRTYCIEKKRCFHDFQNNVSSSQAFAVPQAEIYRKIDRQQIYYSPLFLFFRLQSVALTLKNFDSDGLIHIVIETDATLEFAKNMFHVP
jgi:hypothetical protein